MQLAECHTGLVDGLGRALDCARRGGTDERQAIEEALVQCISLAAKDHGRLDDLAASLFLM